MLGKLIKFCSVAAMVLLVIIALGPAKWTPRTALGWEIDHFLGYFAITSLFCLAWPRPFVVGGSPHGRRGAAGGPASFDTGSLVLFCGCILRRRWGAGGGSACCALHPRTEAECLSEKATKIHR